MSVHLPHTCMTPATSQKVEKTLPEEKKDEYSHRGRGQYQMSRTVFTTFIFTKHNDSLCIEQQPFFQKAAAASSVWDWEVTCFLSLFVKPLLSITCKVPHKSRSTIRPHRDIIPGSYQAGTHELRRPWKHWGTPYILTHSNCAGTTTDIRTDAGHKPSPTCHEMNHLHYTSTCSPKCSRTEQLLIASDRCLDCNLVP